jgi:hypothetical protein
LDLLWSRYATTKGASTPSHASTMEAVSGAPSGIRIRVATLKGWCPSPLDDGGTYSDYTRPEEAGQLLRSWSSASLALVGIPLASHPRSW